MVPSGAAYGSCGREPSVGAIHSLMLIFRSPGTTTVFGRSGRSGKLLPRYAAMIFARSSGSFTIESNVWRQSASVAPHDCVMLFRPWHFVHSCATASLPGPSGRSAAPPFLWPDTGVTVTVHSNAAAATRSPSEYFDISPLLRVNRGKGTLPYPFPKGEFDDSGAFVVCGRRPDSHPGYGVGAADAARQFDELYGPRVSTPSNDRPPSRLSTESTRESRAAA